MKITAKTNWKNAKGETKSEDFVFFGEDSNIGDITMGVHWILTQREGANFICETGDEFDVEVVEEEVKYEDAVTACYHAIALGEIQANLESAEKWVARQFPGQFNLGGKALEAGFDALVKCGIDINKI